MEAKWQNNRAKAITLPVADNLLNQDFVATKPNQKMVSDITYLWAEEGWLYIAAVMDLCGQKIVGLVMGDRLTKDLVVRALEAAHIRAGRPTGVLIHSDRGSQYCSHDYQNLLKRYGFICSMSRKGNCWDNAPAERAVFESVEVFCNGKRTQQSNDYLTPLHHYDRAAY